ncbi:CD276 antigen-like isoform X1 [Gopherus flavomarginatus]|uniref:CD276 antigen-like isoform X1 n=1 Tax=Gopherus flavomarginatus TaxID=286002 RepID=UPI0021CBAD8B|nr:CD276 antigen-like isoform X1 [Gopherus flavomarginatus]
MSLTVALLLLTQLSSLWGLGTDELPVQLPATSEAVLGGTALLSCTYPPEVDLILYWTRLGPASERNVYTYYRGEHLASHDDPAYRGRATVPAGQPGRGDGALWLHNVTLADEGRYRCRVKSNRGMGFAETELRLIGLYRLSWLQPQPCSPSLQNVTLTCRAEGGYPLATVTIHDSTGRDYGAGTLAAKDAQGLYSAAHTADVPCSPPASYTCFVSTTFLQQNRTGTLVREEPQPAWKGWAGIAMGIGLAVVVLGSGALWGQRHREPHPSWEAEPAREEALLEGTSPTCTRRGDPPDILQVPRPASQHLTTPPSVPELWPGPSPGPSHARTPGFTC